MYVRMYVRIYMHTHTHTNTHTGAHTQVDDEPHGRELFNIQHGRSPLLLPPLLWILKRKDLFSLHLLQLPRRIVCQSPVQCMGGLGTDIRVPKTPMHRKPPMHSTGSQSVPKLPMHRTASQSVFWGGKFPKNRRTFNGPA